MTFDVESLYGRHADNRWNRVSVTDLVERVTWSDPDRIALLALSDAYGDERFASLTYRQLDELTNQIAQALIGRGVGRGDIVLIVGENSAEGYAMKLGTAKAGAVGAALNPSMAPDVIADIVRRIEPHLVVADGAFVDHVTRSLEPSGLAIDVTIPIGGEIAPGSVSFADFVADQPTTEPEVAIHGDDIWEILFTSGTTSMPKAAMMSHVSGTMSAHGFALSLTRGLDIESDLVSGTQLPMVYHVGHTIFILATFAAGGTFVLGRRPDPVVAAKAVADHRITMLWAGSPAMVAAFEGAASAAERDISSLTVLVYGWGAVPPATFDKLRAQARELKMMGIFGQTESIACHRFWPSRDEDVYRTTAPVTNYVGRPSALLASEIVDAEGNSLAGQPGIAGEAIYRTPSVTAGYYRDNAATRAAFTDGWFHSGDSCMYDENGLRIMVDRFKDIVKTGGENVSSLRVESVVVGHPLVEKAAVIGLADERWGEVVTAVVVPVKGAEIDPDNVIAYARERLAGYETPKRIIITDALPETVGGKVLKYKLRKLHS